MDGGLGGRWKPGRPGQWWQSPEAGTGLDGRTPGAGVAGPGLASRAPAPAPGLRKWEWRAGAGRGQGAAGAGGLCRNREEEQAWLSDDAGREGRPGKHVRAAGPEPGPPPFSAGLTGEEDAGRAGPAGGKGVAEPADDPQMVTREPGWGRGDPGTVGVPDRAVSDQI